MTSDGMFNTHKIRNAHAEMKALIRLSEEDPEDAHLKADELLCDLLKENGYGYLIALYSKVKKHYT